MNDRIESAASVAEPAEAGPVVEPDFAGRLDIVSDAICPWCYIGKRQLERALPALADQGLRFTVHWHPFQLNPDMPEEGVARRAYREAKFGSPERAAALDRKVSEAAGAVGLDFHLERLERTPNTVNAHRLVWLAGHAGVQDAVMEAIFRAYFTEGADIGAPDILAACAEAGGLDPARARAFLASDKLADEVRAADLAAREAGVNGVPSFFLEGYGLFSGALPAEKIAEALARAHGIIARRRAEGEA